MQAVDYSWSHPSPTAIKAAKYVGALRYLSYESGKNISLAEAQALHNAGLGVGLVWETTANMMLRGAAGGADDSREANRQADALGFPADRPIYYAVDFQPSGAQYAALDAYMSAVTGRTGGVYGCYDVAEHFGQRQFKYIWQCAAWSGNGSGSGGSIQGRRVSKYACLFQEVGYTLNNSSDVNDILKDDWGQWPFQGAPTPTPTPEVPDMKAIYKFENSPELWELAHGYIHTAEKEDDNGTPHPVTIDKAVYYFIQIPDPDTLTQLRADGELENRVRLLSKGDDALDAFWHNAPHVRA